MTENTNIEVKFTYNIADEYLAQTNKLKRTAEWTYKGPDKMWIFIDATTKKITSRFHYCERDNGAEIVAPENMIKVFVDATADPIIASIMHNEWIYADLPQFTETLPDGSTYGHSDPIPPDHTYELEEIVYDTDKNKFVTPFKWKQPHRTWEDLIQMRNNLLRSSDARLAAAAPQFKADWEEYRQKLRDMPVTFAGIGPWKVAPPAEPKDL